MTNHLKNFTVSFEFFPPKEEEGDKKLWETILKLKNLNPKFISITFGAGGSTQIKTDKWVKEITSKTDLTPAAHLTCIGYKKEQINDLALDWYKNNIKHIVALRGDPPIGTSHYIPTKGGYSNAADLVKGLKKLADFEVSVAGYPEKHPDSKNIDEDFENLKKKVDAGANRILTQFFFDADYFLKYRDTASKYGVDIPIVPGILPVSNFKKAVQFGQKCGTTIPDWMYEKFSQENLTPYDRTQLAIECATNLCQKLKSEGVNDFHFYTLNRSELITQIIQNLYEEPLQKIKSA